MRLDMELAYLVAIPEAADIPRRWCLPPALTGAAGEYVSLWIVDYCPECLGAGGTSDIVPLRPSLKKHLTVSSCCCRWSWQSGRRQDRQGSYRAVGEAEWRERREKWAKPCVDVGSRAIASLCHELVADGRPPIVVGGCERWSFKSELCSSCVARCRWCSRGADWGRFGGGCI